MPQKITITTIQNQALDIAAHVYAHATPADRDAIVRYAGCLRLMAKPGRLTRVQFEGAMSRVTCADYLRLRAALDSEAEKEYLDDKIALWVARISNPKAGII